MAAVVVDRITVQMNEAAARAIFKAVNPKKEWEQAKLTDVYHYRLLAQRGLVAALDVPVEVPA